MEMLLGTGNGKTHRTPLPVGVKRIKRVGFKGFLRLKKLLKGCAARELNFVGPSAPRIDGNGARVPLPWPRKSEKRNVARKSTSGIAKRIDYEPTNIDTAYDGESWQWHRVVEWHRYINDPYENIKRTHNNLI